MFIYFVFNIYVTQKIDLIKNELEIHNNTFNYVHDQYEKHVELIDKIENKNLIYYIIRKFNRLGRDYTYNLIKRSLIDYNTIYITKKKKSI